MVASGIADGRTNRLPLIGGWREKVKASGIAGIVLHAVLAIVMVRGATTSKLGAEEPLITDRPDFTESANSVGRGVVQFESGVTFIEFPSGTNVTTLGEILVRWGVSVPLELRFQIPTYEWKRNGDSTSGFQNGGIGLKYELASGDGRGIIAGAEAAVIASTTLPTGPQEIASPKWQPSAVAAISWKLGPNTGLGMNLGISRPADENDRYTSTWLSAALGVGVGAATWSSSSFTGSIEKKLGAPTPCPFRLGSCT